MKNNKKFIGIGLGALATAIAFVLGITTIRANLSSALYQQKSSTDYSLTLNSTNAIGQAGSHDMYTARGNKVAFTYNSVQSSSGNHTKIDEDGYICNTDQITSIGSIAAVFTGTGSLKASIAYTTEKWSEPFELISGREIETGSHPYFVKFIASNGYINLTSATIKFTCVINPDAEPQDTSGSYDIEFAATGSDSSSDISSSSSSIMAQVSDGSKYISSFTGGSKIYAGTSGLKFGSGKAAGNLTINFESTEVVNTITTIDIATAQYGSDTGNFRVYVNGSSSYTTITPSAGGSVSVNEVLTSLEIETTSNRAYLCGLTLNYGGTSEPGTPDNPEAYVTGFTASDAKKDSYTTNSIFANETALNVVKNLSDGSSVVLNPSEYSYTITDANDQIIDPTAKFPAEGVYTLTVSYGAYIPQEITLIVGEYVYITDVAASMTTTTFNTADNLASHLQGNLTANLEYSNDTSSSDIAYNDFAANGIGMYLLTPKGITYDINQPFGTAGVWKVQVYSLTDEENIHYDISITINAIPVQTITLNESSYTLTVEGTLQLSATVNPTNATNPAVVWTSNNDEVATVDDSGLVTAVAVGGATITATAADGSNVYGSCAVTVNAKPVEAFNDVLTRSTTGVSGTTYTSWSGKSKTGYSEIKSDAVYAGQSAGGNDSIQLRSNNSNSGIVTTTSGGTISKVTVSWNSSTSGRTLNVYGKSTAYNSPSDLYGSNSGTLIGTISSDSQTELTISGNYSYVGVRSSSGALYMDSITFSWGEETPTTPVYPTSISLSGTNSITIGETSQLDVTYSPADTNVKNVTYTSSNTSVATVSNTGLVTGVAQGSATITATAEAASGTVSTTYGITVTPVAVTSVTIDTNSASVKVGKTITLIATVNPSNATNKTINWSSSATSVATVNSSGVVTGVAAGSATITATSAADSTKKATCVVTVTASSGEEEFSISYTDLPTTYQTGSTVYTADSGIKFQAYNCANYSSKMQFKASSGYLQNTEDLELQSITINDRESNTLTVYGSNTAGSFSTEITGTNDVYDLTGYSYFKIARTASGAGYCSSITVVTGTPTPTDPTSIIMSPTSAEVGIGGTKQLSISYVPSNANQNKELTWTSSNTNVATVSSDGLVSVKSTASAGQTATITARLTNISSIYATCTITVTEQKKDDHTVLLYICGADLESKNSLATGDIQEILKVSGQPDDVNIVIETGGASSWASTYGISSTKLERWHVENKSLVKDASLTYASMGLTSTLQSFIEYGLNNYPAERTGLVLWNHGGGMHGVCYDEKKSDDSLLDNEVKSAVSGALSNCGMSGQKLEWIGYDACLMAVQDIAEMNSPYFNYMIASEESEAGYGWDYDNWVDDLYAKKTTPVILKAICDSFISDNGGVNSSSSDQTLSYLDLSKASAYKTAWEAMASQLQSKLTSSNKSTFNNAIINNVKHFADSDYDYFCLFDAKDFINKLASNSAFSSFRIDSSYTTAVLNAHADLVAYSTAQKGAGNAFGLCMYWCNNSTYSDMSVYTTSHTNFTTWRSINNTYGTHK